MKNKNLVIYIILFIILMGGAVLLYNHLTKGYNPQPVESEITQQEEGEKIAAPDFTVFDSDGQAVNLSDFKGKPAVVNFWATWCPPCKAELPYFESLYKEHKEDINFLMVNMTDGQRETEKVVKDFLAETGYTFPVYYDTEYSAAYTYGASSIPITLFIDADGNLLGYYPGAMNETTLTSYVESLLK